MPEPSTYPAWPGELASSSRTGLDVPLAEYGDRWRCWRGLLTGAYYAIRIDRPVRGAYQIRAETPTILREQICHADAQDQDLPLTFFGAATTAPATTAPADNGNWAAGA